MGVGVIALVVSIRAQKMAEQLAVASEERELKRERQAFAHAFAELLYDHEDTSKTVRMNAARGVMGEACEPLITWTMRQFDRLNGASPAVQVGMIAQEILARARESLTREALERSRHWISTGEFDKEDWNHVGLEMGPSFIR